jgi:hypothetical protein
MMIIGCDLHTRYQQIAVLGEMRGQQTGRFLTSLRSFGSLRGLHLDLGLPRAYALGFRYAAPAGLGFGGVGGVCSVWRVCGWISSRIAVLGSQLQVGRADKRGPRTLLSLRPGLIYAAPAGLGFGGVGGVCSVWRVVDRISSRFVVLSSGSTVGGSGSGVSVLH